MYHSEGKAREHLVWAMAKEQRLGLSPLERPEEILYMGFSSKNGLTAGVYLRGPENFIIEYFGPFSSLH